MSQHRTLVCLVFAWCVLPGMRALTKTGEADALRELYRSTWPNLVNDCCKAKRNNCGSCRWKNSGGWIQGDPCDDRWCGVTCESCPSCRVTGISLSSNNLKGKIPDGWLKKLPDLRVLRLQGNGISGSFPDELADVPFLEDLRLGGSHTGPLPKWDSHPETFKHLHFHGSFEQPTLHDISTLTALESFYLANTRVGGKLPDFDSWTQLLSLYIRDNDRLSGTIPPFSRGVDGHFTKLTSLTISNNGGLSGTIPPFTDVTQAKTIRIDEQRGITGTIPETNTMTNLVSFDVSHNELYGTVPLFAPETQNTLKKVYLESNYLWELPMLQPVPTNYDVLEELVFEYNTIQGTMPCHTAAFPLLEILRGGHNRLTGTLPCLDKLGVIEVYSLEVNDLSGMLPENTAAPATREFKISNNNMSGTIPQGFVNGLFQAQTIWLGTNGFTGTLPELSSLSELRDLRVQRCSEYEELIPRNITAYGSLNLDTTLAAARDNDPATEWKCLPGNGNVCNILVDFGEPVCLENIRVLESSTRRGRYSNHDEREEDVEGCIQSLRVYQGGKSFSLSEISEEFIWLDGADHGHGWNWDTCSPGTWRNIGRSTGFHENNCRGYSYGEGGGWDPYCRDRTQYYRIQVKGCSTAPCRIPEMKFYAGKRMSGTIPILPPSLNTFHAYGNQLTGTIPISGPSWGDSILVSDNWLEGPVPDFCPSFGSIRRVWMDHNRLTGSLPSQECMSSVTSMRLGHNMLSGTIPTCPCAQLEEYMLDGNACCLRENPVGPGHNSWRDEELTKSRAIWTYTNCPRYDCESSEGGLEGPLPDFTKYPKLQRFGADNNSLRGPINASVASLRNIRWFRVRNNKIAGTLPYREMIEAVNSSRDCHDTSWYLTNNSIWGPVPDLPGTVRPCVDYGCDYSGRRDGRTLLDLFLDYNYLWGPLPTRFERTRDKVVVNHNCWDCPIPQQAIWGPDLSPDYTPTDRSPSGWKLPKKLLRPPDCGEGPNKAQRYELDGPSCPAEPPNSLYEHVDRCRSRVVVNATVSEEEVRAGGFAFALTFADQTPLPFWAPGLWRCLLCEDARGTADDCSNSLCPFGPGGVCPIDVASATCPDDVPLVSWPFNATDTCPVGAAASCPTDVCLVSPYDCSLNSTCPAGQCPQSRYPCVLNSTCPFGPEGETYTEEAGACANLTEIMHAPDGLCAVQPNGTCPAGECNYPWSCNAGIGGTPWGPLPLNFSIALRQLFFDGMRTRAVQRYQEMEMGYSVFASQILPLSAFSLGPSPGDDPYVNLPTHLWVNLQSAPLYDTSVTEAISVTVWDELLLAPFGVKESPVGYWFITPSPGFMSGPDMEMSEEEVRGKTYEGGLPNRTLVVTADLNDRDTYGGWETWRCEENYTALCPIFRVANATPPAPRTCNFECATGDQAEYPAEISVVQCDAYSLSIELILPSYNIPDYSRETVEIEFTGNCTASGLPPADNVITVHINALAEPEPTPTVSLTQLPTPTATASATATLRPRTPTLTETTTPTMTNIPFCLLFPDSAVCEEVEVHAYAPWFLILLLLFCGCCLAALALLLLPKKKEEPVVCTVDRPTCTVQRAPPPSEPEVTIGVSSPNDVVVGVKPVEGNDIQIGVKAVKVPTVGSEANDVVVGVSSVPLLSSISTLSKRTNPVATEL